jgi:hypothetical protein
MIYYYGIGGCDFKANRTNLVLKAARGYSRFPGESKKIVGGSNGKSARSCGAGLLKIPAELRQYISINKTIAAL